METGRQRPARNLALDRLDVLVGDWVAEASVDGQPVNRSRSTFAWLDGDAILVEHATAEASTDFVPSPEWVAGSPLPTRSLIGLDDTLGTFTMLYTDARGVCRVYQVSLDDGGWRIWRDAPGFSQRFTGTFSDDKNIIYGRWERSSDDETWFTDFELTYTRVA